MIRRITTNFKTKNTQNCQKIELYRSLTTKDLKKLYSSRWVGGVETGSWSGEDIASWQQVVRWWQQLVECVVTHSCVVKKNHGDTLWVSNPSPRQDFRAQDSSPGKIKPPNFWLKNQWQQKKLPVSQESLECTQTHPLWESQPGQQLEGHQLYMGSGWSDWGWGEGQASSQKLASSGIVLS